MKKGKIMKTIKLNSGETIQMREPKVKDMKIVNGIDNEFDRELAMIVNLTGKTPNEIDELSMKDFSKVDEALKDFLY